jgi:hypothetical protein
VYASSSSLFLGFSSEGISGVASMAAAGALSRRGAEHELEDHGIMYAE